MSLEDLRSIADERTRHIVMTPEMERRIIRNVKKPRTVSRTIWVAAAACFVLMVVSGVALVSHMGAASGEGGMVITAQLAQGQTDGQNVSEARTAVNEQPLGQRVSDSVAQDDSIRDIDLAALPKPVAIGAYSEGYAPAQNAEGLWGYVDADGAWVLPPVYTEVTAVKNLQSTAIRPDGISVTPLFKAAQ